RPGIAHPHHAGAGPPGRGEAPAAAAGLRRVRAERYRVLPAGPAGRVEEVVAADAGPGPGPGPATGTGGVGETGRQGGKNKPAAPARSLLLRAGAAGFVFSRCRWLRHA